MIDITLTEDPARVNELLGHRPDCPMVQEHRRENRFIATMFGCEETVLFDPTIKLHSCLKDEKQRKRQ